MKKRERDLFDALTLGELGTIMGTDCSARVMSYDIDDGRVVAQVTVHPRPVKKPTKARATIDRPRFVSVAAVIDGDFFDIDKDLFGRTVLLTGQTNPAWNGVYRVGSRGGLSRLKPPPDVEAEYIGRRL